MRKPRLTNTKKPVEKNRVLTAQQIWYSEYFHTNESEFFFFVEFGQDGELRSTPFIPYPQRFLYSVHQEEGRCWAESVECTAITNSYAFWGITKTQ